MLKLSDLCLYLDGLFPSKDLSDYCPNGLQIEGKEKIGKLATAVSASLATIETAVEMGVDALIVHHGIFWQRDSYVIQGAKRKKIALLLQQQISLLAYHLPMDRHTEFGNNWKAAQDLGWFDLEPFSYLNGVPIGVKGKIWPTSRERVKESLERYYQHSAACALGGPEDIHTLALVSGGAHKAISDAVKAKVDAFITGSFDEPIWYQAFEEEVNFFALGHSATERVGPQALASHLEHNFRISCPFLDIPNPF